MKTNQVMLRNNPAFIQRTSDGYFSATNLVASWNSTAERKVQLNNYLKTDTHKVFVEQLIKEGIESPLITTRGKYGGTWMHPKLFIDFAMYVSVEFKSLVLDYVLDGLIQSRHDAGDNFNLMCAAILESAVTKPKPTVYIIEANMIKEIAGVQDLKRNEMSESNLKAISMLQKANALYIKKGFSYSKRRLLLKDIMEILN